MTFASLPPVQEDKFIPIPHFPTRFHAAVFRLWETVTAERMAEALEIPLDEIQKAAKDMGLPNQKRMESWPERGYITTIRNAWHVLPYEQLLRVLGWTEQQLAATLKEDDFLDVKLGMFKPYCEPVRCERADEEQKKQLEKIKSVMEKEFSGWFDGAEPFQFFPNHGEGENKTERKAQDGIRMIYSYCGLYGNVLETDIALSYPDSLLKMYQETGVNAVWLPAVLYQLTEFPFDPSRSAGWEKRQERLRTLVERAAHYGIKVFLYLNEPRSMPLDFFEKRPELRGRTTELYASMCMSDPRVLEYLRNAVHSLCKAVPGLGGFFAITFSENLTHCKSRNEGTACEKCRDIPPQKLAADVLCAISEESRKVDPSIQTIAWTWSWSLFMSQEEIHDCIERLPKEIILMSNSEVQKKFCIGGVEGAVEDYSMSIPGPGEQAKAVWSIAKDKGHETCAKVQVNNTWECSTVPFLPVFDLIREHMQGLRAEGVRHLMLSWTLGGYPSVNLKIASQCLTNPDVERYREILWEEYGSFAPAAERAAAVFSEAFREFPFDIGCVYCGPQNAGPSNLLYEKATGFQSTMTCYAYDDLDGWRSIYPAEVFCEQLRKLSEKWKEGLALLEGMPENSLTTAAWGGYALFYSSYLQTEFVLCRERGDFERLRWIVSEERGLALLMYHLMLGSSLIGYEAANHYYFNKGMLIEKALCCDYLAEQYRAAE